MAELKDISKEQKRIKNSLKLKRNYLARLENGVYKAPPKYMMPLIYIAVLCGVSVNISSNHAKKWFQLMYVILMAGIFTFLSTFEAIQFILAFGSHNPGQNGPPKQGPLSYATPQDSITNKLSYLTLLSDDFFTLVVIVYLFCNIESLQKFYTKWHNVSVCLIDFLDADLKGRFLFMLYGLYIVLSATTLMGFIFNYLHNGQQNPMYVTSLFNEYWSTFKYPGLLFYAVKPIIVMVAWAFVEVTVALASHSIKIMFMSINNNLFEAVVMYEKYGETGKLMSITGDETRNSSVHSSLRRKFSECNMENIRKKIPPLITRRISSQPIMSPDGSSISMKSGSSSLTPSLSSDKSIQPGFEDICERISNTINDHYILTDLTQTLNSIFGPLILLGMCLYLLMITMLLYGTITSLSNEAYDTALMFFLCSVNYIVRVLVLLPTYSAVNRAANEIIVTFARITTWAPESLVNRMALYLQHLGNDPIGISAWGFFTITLGSMLTFGGSVITYLVILFKDD